MIIIFISFGNGIKEDKKFKGALSFSSNLIYYYFVFVSGSMISCLPSDNSLFIFNETDHNLGIEFGAEF